MIADYLAALLSPPRSGSRSWDRLDPKDPAIAKILGMGNNVRSKVRVDGGTVLAIPAVLRGVSIIGNAMMKVRPSIYKRLPNGGEDDKERDKAHSSWRFVNRRANDYMSAGYFRKMLTSWAILRGNGLGYIQRNANSDIIEAIPLLPDRSGMAIFRDGQKLSPDAGVQQGELRKLLPENVIHIKGMSHNGYWGIDIVDALAETFGLSIAPRDFSAAFFGQGATPTGIVFAPTGLKKEDQKDFSERLRAANEGLGKAHRLMILEDTAKYQQLTIDPEKAALIATREFERVEIADVIGIQPHKIGDSSRVSYNSLEQSNQEHLDDDLDPWLQVWEDELEFKCLTEEEKENDSHLIEFNRKALVRVNLAARTARHQFERQNGIATANDILRQENQRPIGDVGDTYMVPANMTVLGKDGLPIIKGQAAPETSPRDRPPEDPPEDEDDANNDRGAFRELALFEVERLTKRAMGEAARQAKNGDKSFIAFLDQLPTWTHEPACIAPVLKAAAANIRSQLEQMPSTANGLEAAVQAAAERIAAETLSLAREQLEAIA